MRSLNLDQGASDPRKLETAGRQQILQKVGNPSEENGRSNPARKGDPLYVGITSQESNRVEEKNLEKEKEKVLEG